MSGRATDTAPRNRAHRIFIAFHCAARPLHVCKRSLTGS
jgi:hypothetical protein